jgi:hypothetical protein
MNGPEQLDDKQTQQYSDDTRIEVHDDAIEIAADVLEQVAGGGAGGGGVGSDP